MIERNIFYSAVRWLRLYEEQLIDIPLNRLDQVSVNMANSFAEYSDVRLVGAIVKYKTIF